MKLQKRLAAQKLMCGTGKVRFDTEKLTEIKEAITKADISRLIKHGTIRAAPDIGCSRLRARGRHTKKRKGQRKGAGTRKGPRTDEKREWINAVRTQRRLLKKWKQKKQVSNENFRTLYAKVKGGFFRNARHLINYAKEEELIK